MSALYPEDEDGPPPTELSWQANLGLLVVLLAIAIVVAVILA